MPYSIHPKDGKRRLHTDDPTASLYLYSLKSLPQFLTLRDDFLDYTEEQGWVAKKDVEGMVETPPAIIGGRECTQNRDVGFYSDEVKSYNYNSRKPKCTPLSPSMRGILDWANSQLLEGVKFGEVNGERYTTPPIQFNGILVNIYRAERFDSIGAHSDAHINPDVGVFGISMGATRQFRVHSFKFDKKTVDIPVKDGWAMWMTGRFQEKSKHSIQPQKRFVKALKGYERGDRVSLTFRCHTVVNGSEVVA